MVGEADPTRGANFTRKSNEKDYDLAPKGSTLVYKEISDLEETKERSPTAQPTPKGASLSTSGYTPWGKRFANKKQVAQFSEIVDGFGGNKDFSLR